MSGIGEQLTAAREERGMSVVDAARRLNLRSNVIAALEQENWRAVGEPIYARGFLKNYARLVGVDQASALAQFDAENRPPEPIVPENTPEPIPVHEDRALAERIAMAQATRNTWLLGSMTAMAAVLVIAVLWYTFIGPGPSATQAQPQTAEPPLVSATAAPANQIFTNAQGSEQSVAAAPNKNGVDVRLELTQDSWLAVTVDGKQVLYQTLPAGSNREFHGDRLITLRAGNAGGVLATVDGQPLGALGENGHVEERAFAVKGTSSTGTGPRE